MINPIKATFLLKSPLVERIITRKIIHPDGEELFETTTFLKNWDHLFEAQTLYSNASGAGTGRNQLISALKACSEAIERYSVVHYRNTNMYGMNLYPSTTGIAGYPGFYARQARDFALNEAVERWSIVEWWRGGLNHEICNIENSVDYYVKICHPFNGIHFFIYVVNDEESGARFGFGSSRNRRKALWKAKVEAYRNLRLKFDINEPTGLNEKRAKFFSKGDGFSSLQERLEANSTRFSRIPRLVVDEEVRGEWSSYCNLWRCLFLPTDGYPSTEQIDFFMF